MLCDRCHAQHDKLFKIFKGFYCPSSMEVCSQCLVGEFVPVLRPSCGQWSIGRVSAVSDSNSDRHFQFSLCFGTGGSDNEWVEVLPDPFHSYAAFHSNGSERPAIDPQQGRIIVIKEPVRKHDYSPLPYAKRVTANPRSRFGLAWPPTPVAATVLGKREAGAFYQAPYYQRPPPAVPVLPYESRRSYQETLSRLWTANEDRLLMQEIVKCPVGTPLKWTVIANAVPHRTGKQCRERYINHLKPSVNVSEWSPVEDSLLFQHHRTMGPRWTIIAGRLVGRTNNNCKNRFHFVRRRLGKDVSNRGAKCIANKSSLKLRLLKRLINFKQSNDSFAMDILDEIVESLHMKMPLPKISQGYKFVLGDVQKAAECGRCGLTVPSRQTGSRLCTTTSWCESCTNTPAYVGSDLLRLWHDEVHKPGFRFGTQPARNSAAKSVNRSAKSTAGKTGP